MSGKGGTADYRGHDGQAAAREPATDAAVGRTTRYAQKGWTVRLAWGLWAICLTATVAALALGLVAAVPAFFAFLGAGQGTFVLLLVASFAFPTVGALVASRRPRNIIGWLFLAYGLLWSAGVLAAIYSLSGPRPGREYVWWVAYWSISSPVLFPALLTLLLLLFPDGRMQSSRWRPVVWISVAATVAFTVLHALSPGRMWPSRVVNPFGVEALGPFAWASVSVALAVWACVAVAGVSFVLRFRRSSGIERLQLRWFASAGVFLAAIITSAPLLMYLGWFWSVPWLALFMTGTVALAVASGIAIIRHRLYAIDRIISRAVSYTLLSVILAGVYVGGVVGLGGAARAMTGQESTDLVVAASTLVVAALFQPARHRTQTLVDRRFNRARYDAQVTVDGFAHRLRDPVDLAALIQELREVTAATLQPARMSVWLNKPEPPRARVDERG